MKKIGILLFILLLCVPMKANAEELQEETKENILSQFEFQEIETFLKELFPNEKISFRELVDGLVSGEINVSIKMIGEMISKQFLYEFRNTKESMVHILIIVIVASVFYNFSGVFPNSQISELSFYVLYMLLVTICLNSFRVLIGSALTGIENLLDFLLLMSPIYFLAVAIATGSATSVAFYNMILILVCIVEFVIQNFLIPFVQVYIVVRFVNELSKEEYLSKFGELIQTIITWSLRIIFGGVIGLNLIQGMLSPAIDSVKRSVLLKSGEAIPVIGDLLGGTSEVILGTAVLIKNGIGVAGAIICIVICMTPVVEMGVITLLYKLVAAIVQPVSEKRIIGCISSMSDGTSILLRVIFTSGALFLITIAMVANVTG